MNRPFASLTAKVALAVWLLGTNLPADATAATTDPAQKENAADAQALKLAQAKLAALAKEGASETPATETKAKSPGKKKSSAKAKKKKKVSSKVRSRATAAAKGGPPDRRMTQSEVRRILSTSRDFSGSNLSGVNLVGFDLSGANFSRANLHSANLERADLAETDLELADLTGANLRGASLNQARLRGTKMAGARVGGALWTDKSICRESSVGSCIE